MALFSDHGDALMVFPNREPRLRDLSPRRPTIEVAYYSRCASCETVWTNPQDYVAKCPSCRPALVPCDPIACDACGHLLALTREHLCQLCTIDVERE